MKGRGAKKGAWAQPPHEGKAAVAGRRPGGKDTGQAGPRWAEERPAWRLGLLELCEPYGWHRVEPGMIPEVQSKLKNFESMTWAEILVKGNKQNHSVERFKLCKEAQKRLEELKLEPDDLVSLRLSGESRIWGIQEDKVLVLLWWDPDHEICPSHLKGT